MEVIKENVALLCNSEVLNLLKELQEKKKGVKNIKLQESLNTIVYETVKYLEESPCESQTPESVRHFLNAVKKFKLTKAEQLQLLNQRPATLVEIQLLIEESEERLTEEQMQDILTIVAETLPGKDAPDDIEMHSEDENV